MSENLEVENEKWSDHENWTDHANRSDHAKRSDHENRSAFEKRSGLVSDLENEAVVAGGTPLTMAQTTGRCHGGRLTRLRRQAAVPPRNLGVKRLQTA